MWKTIKLFFCLTVALLSACGLMRLGELGRLSVEIESPRPSQEIGVRDGEALVLPLKVRSNGRVIIRVLDEGGGEIRTLDPPDSEEATITNPATMRRLLDRGYVDLLVVARAYRGEDSFEVPGFGARTSQPVEIKETDPVRVRFIKAFTGPPPKLDFTVHPKIHGVGWLGFTENVTPTLTVSVSSPSRKLLVEYQGVDGASGGVLLPSRRREVAWVPNERQTVEIDLVPLKPGQKLRLQGTLVDGGGNETRFDWRFQTDKVDHETLTLRWLGPISTTLGFRNRWTDLLPETRELKSREAWTRVPTEDHYDIGGITIFAFLTLLGAAVPFLRR